MACVRAAVRTFASVPVKSLKNFGTELYVFPQDLLHLNSPGLKFSADHIFDLVEVGQHLANLGKFRTKLSCVIERLSVANHKLDVHSGWPMLGPNLSHVCVCVVCGSDNMEPNLQNCCFLHSWTSCLINSNKGGTWGKPQLPRQLFLSDPQRLHLTCQKPPHKYRSSCRKSQRS